MTSDELKGIWLTSKEPSDQGRYLDALVREGRLAERRVALAAGLFHPGARASSIEPVLLANTYQDRLYRVLAALLAKTIVQFAHECAERCLHSWQSFAPADDRVQAALRTCQMWLDEAPDLPFDVLKAAGDTAAQAAIEIDEGLEGAVPDARTSAAMDAANAASSAVLAAAEAARVPPPQGSIFTPEFAASHGAHHAACSAPDYVQEVRWQIDELTHLLLSPTAA